MNHQNHAKSVKKVKILYVGYPINLETVYALFKQPKTIDIKNIEGLGINLYNIDKGLYVLGYGVKELTNHGSKYTSVDETLILIVQYKKRLVEALAAVPIQPC